MPRAQPAPCAPGGSPLIVDLTIAGFGIGNVPGSHVFNLLALMGLPGVIRPGPVPGAALARNFPVMIGLAFGFGRGRLSRLPGGLLPAAFGAYQVYLYFGILR